MNSSPFVYAVDDDPAVLGSLKAILELSGFIVSDFTSGVSFLESAKLDAIGCLITDLNMPGMNGMELQQQLVRAESTLAIIFVTGFASVPSAVQIMESGAVTLLEKPYSPNRLLNSVRMGIEKSSQLQTTKQAKSAFKLLLATLTDEEVQVLDLACTGMPNKTIGRKLLISSRTVDRRRQTALRKLQINSITEYAAIRSINPRQ